MDTIKGNNCNIFGHTTTICATNKIAHPIVVVEGARKVGVVISKSTDNKQNQFQWQVVGKRNKGSVSGENGPCASKVHQNENENGCSTSGIHTSDCNDHVTSDVCNVICHEDKTPTSPHVVRDMEQEEGATCTALDQSLVVSNTDACATVNQVLSTISHELNVDVAAMGGDINACTSLDKKLAVCNTIACATMNPVSHKVNVDIGAMRGDTDKEDADKEIPTSPQSSISSDGETIIN